MQINKVSLYAILEALIGRSLLYKLGRFLYMGARRELLNKPEANGEYALIGWTLSALEGSERMIHLDVGANFGDWSAELLRHPSAKLHHVHSFEPAPQQFSNICKRLANEVSGARLSVHPLALADRKGSASFIVTSDVSGDNAIATESTLLTGVTIQVPLETLDGFVAAQGIERIGIMKVDTEGNDFNVITGARQMLAGGRIAVMQFEYNWRWIAFGHMLHDAFKAVSGLDYVVVRITKDCLEVYREWHPELERFFETNFALVRTDVIERLPHKLARFDSSNTLILA